MIGDGINGSAAIKQAHIGISFAQADSSFSASFTTQDQEISCVEQIIIEGRATMCSVTEVYNMFMVGSAMKVILFNNNKDINIIMFFLVYVCLVFDF